MQASRLQTRLVAQRVVATGCVSEMEHHVRIGLNISFLMQTIRLRQQTYSLQLDLTMLLALPTPTLMTLAN